MEETNQGNKLTYEELERVALQLNAQVKNLSEQLAGERENNAWGRMGLLIECISHPETFDDKEFISKCCAEIKEKLYPKKEASEE